MKKPSIQSGHTLLDIAAYLGIFQGLAWTILAILGVTFRFAEVPKSGTTHSTLLTSALGQVLQSNSHAVPVTGMGLFAVTVVYLVISLVWIGLSTILTLSIRRGQQDNIRRATLAWGVMTLLTCIYDLVVTGLLASDYSEMLTLFNSDIKKNFAIIYLVLAYGTLMSLAARGYVLWVVNFILSVLMIRNARGKVKESNVEMLFDSPPIEAYQAARDRTFGQHDMVNGEQSKKSTNTTSNWNNANPLAPEPHYIYPNTSDTTSLHIPRVKVEMRSSQLHTSTTQLIRNNSRY